MNPDPGARADAPVPSEPAVDRSLRRRFAVGFIGLWLALGLGVGTGPALAQVAARPITGSSSGAPAACSATLQSLVDATPPGATLDAPACIYRETVTITRPIVLVGTAGTEVRGSDIWTTWQASGSRWLSTSPVPPLESGGECRPLSDRCHQPEQVFIDGVAQARVGGSPAGGEFAMSGDRHVILGSNPARHLVEVSTRARWLQVSASGVTVEGITFRHAANGPQAEDAALRVSGPVDAFRLSSSHLFDAHGTLLGLVGGSGHRVIDSELARAGQQGFGFSGVSDTQMQGTSIHDNNLDGFNPGWEAGAGKASRVRGLTLADNNVERNAGPGLWCDIDCRSVTINANRIADNEGAGILFEISSGGTITDNVVTESGWANAAWGWGGGIVISSSGAVDVGGNTLAWNADGITVISQARQDRPEDSGTGITLHDNVVLAAPQPGDGDGVYLIAWLQDWSGPLYSPNSLNRGTNDRFWSTIPESGSDRFSWTAGLSTLDAFRDTPGGTEDTYLTAAAKDAIVAKVGLPATAEARQVSLSLGARLRMAVPLLAGLAATVVLVLAGLRIVRRRRMRRSAPGGPDDQKYS